MDILSVVRKKLNELTEYARDLEIRAERGFELPKTREYIETKLRIIGYEPKTIGKGSISAEINRGFSETVLLRADMDALPSEEGARHLCGHHFHASALLGAADIIFNSQNRLRANIKLLFQAAEESLEGAIDCINAGLLERPKVTEAYMLHVLPSLPFPTGTVIVSSEGISAPAAKFFEIRVKGRSSHGASPDRGIDALICGADIALRLYRMSEEKGRESDFLLTLGKFTSGKAANIIADEAVLEGSMRSKDTVLLGTMIKNTEKIAKNRAAEYRASAEFLIKSGCPPLRNGKAESEYAYRVISAIEGLRPVFSAELDKGGKSLGGSEDFAYIAERVPSCMIGVAAGQRELGYDYPLHHPSVKFDPEALPICAAVYSSLVLK